MNDYNFPSFLRSVGDLGFREMDEAARVRKVELERLLKRGRKKFPEYGPAADLLRQIISLRFWLASGYRPAELTDDEFLQLEPICRKLIEKSHLKGAALDEFIRTRALK